MSLPQKVGLELNCERGKFFLCRAKGQRDDVLEHTQSKTDTDLGFIVSSTGVEEFEKNQHDDFFPIWENLVLIYEC